MTTEQLDEYTESNTSEVEHSLQQLKAGLYLVPVPIGNLGDITLRALEVLRRANVIAAEDTRMTGKLLSLLGIRYHQIISCHEHNERSKSLEIVDRIANGQIVAFVSDAGTPCISDPGEIIVKTVVEKGLDVFALPGATAFVPALIVSGFPTSPFVFLGFPPHKKGRQTFLRNMLLRSDEAIILYESPYRIEKLLDEIIELENGDRKITVSRELTKLHEETLRGTVVEVREKISQGKSNKGEFVVVLAPNNYS